MISIFFLNRNNDSNKHLIDSACKIYRRLIYVSNLLLLRLLIDQGHLLFYCDKNSRDLVLYRVSLELQ